MVAWLHALGENITVGFMWQGKAIHHMALQEAESKTAMTRNNVLALNNLPLLTKPTS